MSQNLPSLPNNLSVDEFFNTMAQMEKRSNFPQPPVMNLKGNVGTYEISTWNKETKEKTVMPWPSKWKGSVLAVRYYSQLEYDADRTFNLRTREFSDFKEEPIELLRISKGETKVEKTYSSYQEFKLATTKTDEMTGKVSSSFQFFVALYILAADETEPKVVKFTFKGDSRSNWFDFNKSYRTDEFPAKALCQAIIEFSSEEKKMTSGTSYYAATFKTVGLADGAWAEAVMHNTMDLMVWMNAWKTINKEPERQVPIEELATIQIEEEPEIKIEEIPF